MLITKLHTPEGVKDYLPKEYRRKLTVENEIADIFEAYGFSPISVPTIEYSEVFENTGSINERRVYKFVDRDGTLLSLRPDFTPSIARIAATSANDTPKKLYYIGTTFRRNESYQGKLREFTQAGIEIIDSANIIAADAEAVIIAINAFKAIGIEEFKIDIGHAKFLSGIIDEADINAETANEIKANILNKNYVAVSEIADSINNEEVKSLLKDLPLLIGDYNILESVKTRVTNKKAQEALDYLCSLYNILKSLGYEKYVSFDLSVIGSMDYYTGIIFRGYTRGTGSSVIDGGRYDNLVSAFGKNMTAVGFAIKINDLLPVTEIEYLQSPKVYVSFADDEIIKAFKIADEIVCESGFAVELSNIGSDYNKNHEYAKSIGADIHCHIDKDINITALNDDEFLIDMIKEHISI